MSRTPRFRINTVAEMTGIPASTLRAWERRYGIPTPQRTSAAYRLYCDDDVELLRKLRDLVESGIAPSEAAGLLLNGEEKPDPEVRLVSGPFVEATVRIVGAVEAFDPAALRVEIARATYLGSAATVFERVLGPAMREVGQRWHDGTMTVAQEHLATEALLGTVRDLHRLIQPEGGDRLALIGALTGEQHVLPLYGVAFQFARWGFRTEVLGANTPPEAIGSAVDALSPSIVGLSMTMPFTEEIIHPMLEQYAARIGKRPWLVGGLASERYRGFVTALGGMCAGEDCSEMRAPVERAVLAYCGLDREPAVAS